MKKRSLAIVLAVVSVIGMGPLTAFAGRNHVRLTTARYSLCNEKNCDIMGVHKHGTVSYLGHYLNDGHDYHAACDITGCQRVDEHEHEYGEFCGQVTGYGCGNYVGTSRMGFGCRR